jgi:hypothetical protein
MWWGRSISTKRSLGGALDTGSRIRVQETVGAIFLSSVVLYAQGEGPGTHPGQVKVNSVDGLQYVWIPPGRFTVGYRRVIASVARMRSQRTMSRIREDSGSAPANNPKWIIDNGGGPHSVAQKQPNAWNLYDMLGNVLQWTADWYDERYYSLLVSSNPLGPRRGQVHTLGGSWFSNPKNIRVSFRFSAELVYQYGYVGFRVCRMHSYQISLSHHKVDNLHVRRSVPPALRCSRKVRGLLAISLV